MSLASRLWSGLNALVTLAPVQSTTGAAAAIQRLRARIAGVDDDVPWLQPFGLQSRPTGGQAVVVAAGGSSDDLVCILVADRRYTLALDAGDVVLHDGRGQEVRLAAGGISVKAAHVTIDSADVRFGTGAGARLVRVGDTVQVADKVGAIAVLTPVGSTSVVAS